MVVTFTFYHLDFYVVVFIFPWLFILTPFRLDLYDILFLFVPWAFLFGSTALCGRHLLLSVATKVSKSALLFQFRSTNESAVAVNFSATPLN